MLFSKTFGYALRGTLFLALIQEEKEKVQLDEIALTIDVPRHFLGKVLKKLVKEEVLGSAKGPHGGFFLKEDTLKTPLLKIVAITDGLSSFQQCVLRFQDCNPENPCPLHQKVEAVVQELRKTIGETTIGDLMIEDKKRLQESIIGKQDLFSILK